MTIAAATADAWFVSVQTFGGIQSIGHASFRGTDGTNAHHFDEEIEARVASLDDETLAMIDEVMDPASALSTFGPLLAREGSQPMCRNPA